MEEQQPKKGDGRPPLTQDEKVVVGAFQARIQAFLWGLISTHKISQKELARRMGVTSTMVAKLLNKPTLTGVARVCAVLGVVPELRVRKLPAKGSLEL